MAEGSTSSVSKGCFLFKKTGSGSPRKRQYANAIDLMDSFRGESEENKQQRYDNLKYCLGKVKEQIEGLQTNSKVFSQLVDYIKNSHGFSKEKTDHGIIREIPTAVLITGVNMPDHDMIFSQLATDLVAVTPYIALMKSKDCTGMKPTMKNMMLQFMGGEQEEDVDKSPLYSHSRLSCFTMPLLCNWYKTKCQKSGRRKSPSKEFTSDSTDYPPMVVIFEDFEGFPPAVVQDFIAVCSQYSDQIPLVLVFGVATAVSTVHRVLPHAVSTLLSIERFQSQPSHACLLEIISKVLMTTKFPFKLGSTVFRFLYENFLFHDFSLQNFSSGLQFCIMEHFYSNPVSVLCCSSTEDRAALVEYMTDEELDIMRRSASFRKYVESCKAQERPPLLVNSAHTKEVMIKLLDDLDMYHWHFFPVLECLHALTGNLPRHPLGRRVRDLYEFSLSSNIYDREEYKEAISLLMPLSYLIGWSRRMYANTWQVVIHLCAMLVYAKDELVDLIGKCVDVLTTSLQDEVCNKYCQDLKIHKEQLASFLGEFDKLGERQEIEVTSTPTQSKDSLPKVVNRFELQEKLRMAAKQKRKDSPFDQLRQKTIDYVDKLFREYLHSPMSMPLHEVMYYDNAQKVKQHLIGMPRVAIQTALSNPHHYLKCDCCDIDAGTIQDSLPDVSIAYKLHLECGRMINLYDWLQAFNVVLDPDPRKSSKKKKKSSEELQARFIRAVSELQFVGFIKPTKRKTDHVQRLTWGEC